MTPVSASPLVRARALTRTYAGARERPFGPRPVTTALHDVDLDIRAESSLGIIGESGSGKSTLVRLLAALDAPTSGTVEVDGRPVDAAGSARSLHWLRSLTGIVFQDPYASLDPRMSVGRIVGEPLWALGAPGDHRARVEEVLLRVGLDAEAAERFPHEFSGGQRQRIALARAIVHRPRLLLADEPLSALDVSVRARIIDLLARLRTEEDLTLVLVSHDIGVVAHVCDEIAVMKDGRIVERGRTAHVLERPRHPYTRELLAAAPVLPPAPDGAARDREDVGRRD
ncbi:ABC transporter ATP-binding protein [Microbacterium aurantiacum]|uniref:ABC transporter ATP-binding protein n=1 Tax=Microbacterium aurantiacum TaxID=162393 RepID=UPI004036782B